MQALTRVRSQVRDASAPETSGVFRRRLGSSRVPSHDRSCQSVRQNLALLGDRPGTRYPLGFVKPKIVSNATCAYNLTGYPKLMGSLTHPGQLDLDEALKERNKKFNVDHKQKAKERENIKLPGVAESKTSTALYETQLTRSCRCGFVVEGCPVDLTTHMRPLYRSERDSVRITIERNKKTHFFAVNLQQCKSKIQDLSGCQISNQ